MKNPNRETVTELVDLPNIGKAIDGDLRLINIQHPQDLIGKNAYELHSELCRVTGEKKDPCVIDVFLAYAPQGKAVPNLPPLLSLHPAES